MNVVKNFLQWNRKGKKLFPFQDVPFNTHRPTCGLDPRDCEMFPLKQVSYMPKFRLRQVSLYKAIKIKMTNVLFSATSQDGVGIGILNLGTLWK